MVVFLSSLSLLGGFRSINKTHFKGKKGPLSTPSVPYLLPSTFYLLPSTFFLLPSTFDFLPCTFDLFPLLLSSPLLPSSDMRKLEQGIGFDGAGMLNSDNPFLFLFFVTTNVTLSSTLRSLVHLHGSFGARGLPKGKLST